MENEIKYDGGRFPRFERSRLSNGDVDKLRTERDEARAELARVREEQRSTEALSSLEAKRLFLSLPMEWRRAILKAQADALTDAQVDAQADADTDEAE